MKKLIPIFIVMFLLSACAPATPAAETVPAPTNRQVSMDEAIAMMEEESDYIILDVRTPEEFAERHIPGAINIANEAIGTEEIPELPKKDQLILSTVRFPHTDGKFIAESARRI